MLAVSIDTTELAELVEEIQHVAVAARERRRAELGDRDGVAARGARRELLALGEVERAGAFEKAEGVRRIGDYAVFDRCPKKRRRSK